MQPNTPTVGWIPHRHIEINRPRHGSVTLPPPVLRVESTSWRGKVVATLERASFLSAAMAWRPARIKSLFRRKETDGSKATANCTDRKREASGKGYRLRPRAS